MDLYQSIVAVQCMPVDKEVEMKKRASAKGWLEHNTQVNMLQQIEAGDHYRKLAADGEMVRDNETVVCVVNDIGHYAQAFNMTANPPNPKTAIDLRKRVDAVQHPDGPSMTAIGDMNVHGRSTAAHRRVSNNGLYLNHVPKNMLEEEQL